MSTRLSDYKPIQEELTDESIITFGTHKGKKLANVPARYLIFLYEQGKLPDNLKSYIIDNWALLKKQEREEYVFQKPTNRRLL